MKTTEELTNEIHEAHNILDYLPNNQEEMLLAPLPECLAHWLKKEYDQS